MVLSVVTFILIQPIVKSSVKTSAASILRTGAAITVVTNAASDDADAGSILYVATVIDAAVLTTP